MEHELDIIERVPKTATKEERLARLSQFTFQIKNVSDEQRTIRVFDPFGDCGDDIRIKSCDQEISYDDIVDRIRKEPLPGWGCRAKSDSPQDNDFVRDILPRWSSVKISYIENESPMCVYSNFAISPYQNFASIAELRVEFDIDKTTVMEFPVNGWKRFYLTFYKRTK